MSTSRPVSFIKKQLVNTVQGNNRCFFVMIIKKYINSALPNVDFSCYYRWNMYLPLCFKRFTNPYLPVATEHKETIKKPSRKEHSPLMGKFRFLHWRSFGNTHRVPYSTVNTKQVVDLGIVGRRRRAIESHFLVVQ